MKIEVAGHTFNLSTKRCETCGRPVHYTKGTRGNRGYWQHTNDGAGLRWSAELRRRAQ